LNIHFIKHLFKLSEHIHIYIYFEELGYNMCCMRDRYPPIINQGIYIYSLTSQFSKSSKKQFWFITTVLNFLKVKEQARETSIYEAR